MREPWLIEETRVCMPPMNKISSKLNFPMTWLTLEETALIYSTKTMAGAMKTSVKASTALRNGL